MRHFLNNNENDFLNIFDNFGQWPYHGLALYGSEIIQTLSYMVPTFHPFIVFDEIPSRGSCHTHVAKVKNGHFGDIFVLFDVINSGGSKISAPIYCWMQNLVS